MSEQPIKIGIIGGSGVDAALAGEGGREHFPDTPFGKPSCPILETSWQNTPIYILKRHGVGHVYPPHNVPFRANICAMKQLGVTHIVATGATGSLREEINPGDLVIVDQLIDKTYKRANTFYEKAAVHVELAEPFCPIMRQWLIHAAGQLTDSLERKIHAAGTYIVMEGPAFSTRAESELHRQWGGDLIGMTAMPEARLAKEAEIAYALIGLPTDYDCWRPHDTYESHEDLLSQIIANLKGASDAGIALIRQALSDTKMLDEQPSPSHDALKLAIWTDRARIDPEEIERLRPLWGRYFK